ncbi:hypothetical protein ANCCAN_10558, partial [Ancylostoma caninum]
LSISTESCDFLADSDAFFFFRFGYRELYAAVPGIRKSLLGVNAKQFGERFHHLQKKISRHSSLASLEGSELDDEGDPHRSPRRSREPSIHSEDEEENEPRIPMGGIANTHFQV